MKHGYELIKYLSNLFYTISTLFQNLIIRMFRFTTNKSGIQLKEWNNPYWLVDKHWRITSN